MNSSSAWVFTVLAATVGLIGGFLAFAWRAKVLARRRKRIPKRWPLHSRVIANTEECKVWVWLSKVFYDHHIMIKIPVTRFTLPRSRESGAHWYQLLSGVYCTFNICAADGRVVGCVDVPRAHGISRSNRQLKLTLLSQCGIAYCVVNSHNLPTMEEIRIEFLGEMPQVAGDSESDGATIAAAREKLHTAINLQRNNRANELGALAQDNAPESVNSPESQHFESDFGAGAWQLNNSFVAPLDSRAAHLP
ncbi:hypothetical protein [Polaromonas sp.]|uniref:hypothetical protein n=1 Tax=Polaromonas sp. TaxID=1869339 RepID=UPI0017EBF066|nr:hypothetical protein [Polaromonas sp.]NML84305.1 hypothetical protein [Polaromonas sp.]